MEVNCHLRLQNIIKVTKILHWRLLCVVQLKEIMHRHQKKGNDENGKDNFSYLFKTLRRTGIQSWKNPHHFWTQPKWTFWQSVRQKHNHIRQTHNQEEKTWVPFQNIRKNREKWVHFGTRIIWRQSEEVPSSQIRTHVLHRPGTWAPSGEPEKLQSVDDSLQSPILALERERQCFVFGAREVRSQRNDTKSALFQSDHSEGVGWQ